MLRPSSWPWRITERDWEITAGGSHQILYQEQIRVPLILRIPGWPAGQAVEELVRTTDILPSVLDAVNVSAPARLDGRSLRGPISGATGSPRLAYADAINLFDRNARIVAERPDDGLLYRATDGQWKLIYRPYRPELSELYDPGADPAEAENLYGLAPAPSQRLLKELTRLDAFVDEPFGTGRDPIIRERLESLGYLASR